MKNFIGYPLEKVLDKIEEEKLSYRVVENNFNVDGDRLLVTNVESQDGVIVLTVGKFIFDIEGKQNEQKN